MSRALSTKPPRRAKDPIRTLPWKKIRSLSDHLTPVVQRRVVEIVTLGLRTWSPDGHHRKASSRFDPPPPTSLRCRLVGGGRLLDRVEVKIVTDSNEVAQLRTGLGQVLDYANQLGTAGIANPILAIERAPSASRWVGADQPRLDRCHQSGLDNSSGSTRRPPHRRTTTPAGLALEEVVSGGSLCGRIEG